MENFGKYLKELRKSQMLSQLELSKIFDVHRSLIGHWEAGRNYPEFKKVVEIVDFFNVSLDTMTDRDKITFNKLPEKALSENRQRFKDVLDGIFIDNFDDKEVSVLVNALINAANTILAGKDKESSGTKKDITDKDLLNAEGVIYNTENYLNLNKAATLHDSAGNLQKSGKPTKAKK